VTKDYLKWVTTKGNRWWFIVYALAALQVAINIGDWKTLFWIFIVFAWSVIASLNAFTADNWRTTSSIWREMYEQEVNDRRVFLNRVLNRQNPGNS